MTDRSSAELEAYLGRQPPEHQALLRDLRARVLALAPDATDAISYGMPALSIGGRPVIWFASWKQHCSVYPVGPGFIADHPELAGHGHSDRGALHFGASQPLSDAVLTDLVRARLEEIAPARR